jgi:hypothetical protein
MNSEYDHAQASDQRFRAAQATSQKSGSAFEYSRQEHSSWWLVLAGVAVVVFAIVIVGL